MSVPCNSRSGGHDRGFAMVALLVGMSIAAIWMTLAIPKWGQQTLRSREADLIFRGEQYARAIMLYMDKNQGALPPNLDILVSQRYLRKKWKDPITGDDFTPVGIGIVSTSFTDPNKAKKFGCQVQLTSGAPINTAGQAPGISGVRSKSCLTSIKVYQQQQAHNYWPFDASVYRNLQNQWSPRNVPGPPGAQQQGGTPGRGGTPARPGDAGRPGGPGRGGGLDGRPAPPPPPTGLPGRGGRGPF